ncbi:hypothetical protein BC826DRAFT_192637 [Russula brevipes]|nr:hypothetical protein BC826DRAFT_192637 [Russula brevipes]
MAGRHGCSVHDPHGLSLCAVLSSNQEPTKQVTWMGGAFRISPHPSPRTQFLPSSLYHVPDSLYVCLARGPPTSLQQYFKDIPEEDREDLRSHPLRLRLESCHSPDAVLTALREQFDQSLSRDERLTMWLDPTVNALWAFSVAVGVAIILVSSQGVHGDSF